MRFSREKRENNFSYQILYGEVFQSSLMAKMECAGFKYRRKAFLLWHGLKDKSATRCLFVVSALVIRLTSLLLIFCCHSDVEIFL
jgi:hypothetical protein